MKLKDEQINLLRTASLAYGKRVLVIGWLSNTTYEGEYIGQSPDSCNHVVRNQEGTLSFHPANHILELPLAWLEDKPVYVGDRVHYNLEDGELACGTVANVASGDLYVMQEGPCLAASRVFWEPKHKYLSADGVELEVEQKVYLLRQGFPQSYHIKKLYTNDKVRLDDNKVYLLWEVFSTPYAKVGEEVLSLDGSFYFSGSPCAYTVSIITESKVILRSTSGDGSIGMSWETFQETASTSPYVNINGFKVPIPETKEPEKDSYFWLPSLAAVSTSSNRVRWEGEAWDRDILARGLVHLSKEAAEIHAKALLSFTEK